MVFSFVSPFSSLSCFPFRLDIARYAPSFQDGKHLKNNCALYHTLILFTYLIERFRSYLVPYPVLLLCSRFLEEASLPKKRRSLYKTMF